MATLIAVKYLLIPVLGDITEHTVLSTWQEIKKHFDEGIEHVAVLYEGQRRDMFVGETSSTNGRHIRNIRGTAIYRNNTLTHSPGTDPESLPAISGPVVLFPNDIVWR